MSYYCLGYRKEYALDQRIFRKNYQVSHQRGIEISRELKAVFAEAKSGSYRLVKVSIDTEKLVLAQANAPIGSAEKDFDELILSSLEPKQPCYLFYRMDTKRGEGDGYDWVFFAYSPDNSDVRQKMLYAGKKATVKREFGNECIKDEVFGTVLHEMSYRSYLQHLKSKNTPGPKTMAEEELELVRRNEYNPDINVDTKHQTLHGIAFPITDDALQKLCLLADTKFNYVQLSIELKKEEIQLELAGMIDASVLSKYIPMDHARYHLFLYRHHHEGNYLESIVFIYSQPGLYVHVKERMLYSSCKSPFIDTLRKVVGMEIVKKIEIGDSADLTEEFLYDELHPRKTVVRPAFAKPKGPQTRGPRRINRN